MYESTTVPCTPRKIKHGRHGYQLQSFGKRTWHPRILPKTLKSSLQSFGIPVGKFGRVGKIFPGERIFARCLPRFAREGNFRGGTSPAHAVPPPYPSRLLLLQAPRRLLAGSRVQENHPLAQTIARGQDQFRREGLGTPPWTFCCLGLWSSPSIDLLLPPWMELLKP